MVSSKMAGDRLGTVGFVKVLLFESDTEALNGPPALRLHDGYHQRRIDSPRKEGVNGHICDHLLRHRLLQQSKQPISFLLFAAFKGTSRSSLSHGLSRPV